MIRFTITKPDRQTITIDHSQPAELTVGRSANCNISLDFDVQASRKHALFLVDPPYVAIRDLHSTNGITINGEKFLTQQGIESPVRALHDGDQIMIGQTKIKVSVLSKSGGARQASPRRALTTHRRNTLKENAAPDTRYFRADDPVNVTASKVEPITAGHETVSNLQAVFPAVPGWELTRFLGAGLNGGVYYGIDSGGRKAAAVKAMAVGYTLSRSMLDSLRGNANEARQARHSSIARIFASGELGAAGGAYLAYEYIPGVNLSIHLQRQEDAKLRYRDALPLMMQMTEAVCFLHRRDILHMDLKPTSVIVNANDGKNRAILTDHGFFDFLDSSGISPRGKPGENLLKLGYVAPEEVNPEAEATPAADVFSLSAIFYSMLTGKPPYRFAPGRDPLKVVRDGWIQPIEEELPSLPVPLVVVIERGLSVESDLRYQTACDLYDALESVGL